MCLQLYWQYYDGVELIFPYDEEILTECQDLIDHVTYLVSTGDDLLW